MHKFTVAEVSTPDFDISRLALDEEEILSIRTRFLNTSLELLKESEQFLLRKSFQTMPKYFNMFVRW